MSNLVGILPLILSKLIFSISYGKAFFKKVFKLYSLLGEEVKSDDVIVDNKKRGEEKEGDDDTATEESTAPLRYPYTKIDEHDDYMKIEIKEFKPPGLGMADEDSSNLRLASSDEAQVQEKTLYTIVLPIPEGISDTKNADWQDGGMGPIRALLSSTVNATLNNSQDRSLATSVKSGASEILSNFNNLVGSDRAQLQNLVTG